MKSAIFRVFSLLLTAAVTAPLSAAEYSGTSGFTFLNIPAGARTTGMGQAFTSIPNDVQGLSYNPASLASLIATQLSLQHLSYVEGIHQESVAFGKAGREERLSWGGSINYLRVGDIPRTVATGSDFDEGFEERGNFSTYDMSVGGSVAGAITDSLLVGGTVKMLHESLADASATGGAVDVGVLWRANEKRSWNAGASLLNLGFVSKFAEADVKLPWTARVGVSGQPFAQWLLSADFVKRRDTKGEVDIGAEVTPRKVFSLRFGYRYQLRRPDLGTLSDFSAGFGIRPGLWSIDYAFVPLGDLGMTHRISFNVRFRPKALTESPQAPATATQATPETPVLLAPPSPGPATDTTEAVDPKMLSAPKN